MAQITGYKRDNIGVYIPKDPKSNLDYTLDWNDWMPAGDSVASATVTATNTVGDSTSLEVGSPTITNNQVTVDIAGGEGGQVYNIEFVITTSNGLIDSRNFRIKCQERQL